MSKAQERAMARYRRSTMSILVRVNPKTEPEIYGRMQAVENKAGYIKELIRRDVSG